MPRSSSSKTTPTRDALLYRPLPFLVYAAGLGAPVAVCRTGRVDGRRDFEILVLRHQLKVLRHKVGQPKFRRFDRIFFAAASRVLPRDRWSSFVVRPHTLLRWHRELVRQQWTYRRTGTPGRPAIDPEVSGLIVGMARENPRWGWVRIQGRRRDLLGGLFYECRGLAA